MDKGEMIMGESERTSPDRILQRIQDEERRAKQGKLKIFFGYAAGVGKTYAMLEAAHEELAKGTDVVAGYIEPHARPDTAALVQGLEVLPTLTITYKDITLHEFDIDGALRRKPQLILVDELAHTNAKGCRHEKRYQDIQELLQAGIDVYTTVNVQHLESLNDIVASITQVTVRERIPDSVFDNADQVELVDIEPADLEKRLHDGKIYQAKQAKSALKNFFTTDNLTALREIALRRMADRVNRIAERTKNSSYHTKEHILVCLSSSPTNPKIIRTAARMANAFNAHFTALFVRTSDYEGMTKANRDRLDKNIRLAELLGATVETVVGDNVALQIAEFSRMSGVSQIVVGRSNTRSGFFGLVSKPFTDQLLAYLPKIDVHVIPDNTTPTLRIPFMRRSKKNQPVQGRDMAFTAFVFILTTAISMAMYAAGLNTVSIIPLYLLGVFGTALYTDSRFSSIVLAALNILAFDFLFIEPRHTFSAYDPSYSITFAILFFTAFLAGELAHKVKVQAIQAARTAYRMRLLLETSQMMQKASSNQDIETIVADQLVKLLRRDIVYYPVDDTQTPPQMMRPHVYTAGGHGVHHQAMLSSPNEQGVALWVYKNKKRAGATTETLGDANCLYIPVRSQDSVYSVIGISAAGRRIEASEINLAESITTEGALALEKELYDRKRRELYVHAQNEQLRVNLLRSISHDLRTPLTSISGNADVLLNNDEQMTLQQRRTMYENIYEDSIWLINLVENILSVTRIENGTMQLQRHMELLDDVVCEALKHVKSHNKHHEIRFEETDDILMVYIDARLIVQVLVNLIDNAIKYTPENTTITVRARRKGDFVEVSVADEGKGIALRDKRHIFEMFYTAGTKSGDSRRGMGLGLNLCQSIVRSHGGDIKVQDNKPHGTIFTFTLPVKEIDQHDETKHSHC